MAGACARHSSRSGIRQATDTGTRPGSGPSPSRSSETPLPDRIALLGEEGRGFFQQVALHPQNAVLGAQPPQLVALGGRQPVLAPASVQVGLAHPIADDLAGAAQILAELVRRAPAFADQADGFAPEFGRVGRMTLRHVDSLRGIIPKRSGVHQSEATSYNARPCGVERELAT